MTDDFATEDLANGEPERADAPAALEAGTGLTPGTGEDGVLVPNRLHIGSTAPDAFDAALRRAISDRGLTLDRLRHHLAQRGHEVSIATLSYWQTGRSRPGRGASRNALADLEDILGLAPGELAARITGRARPPRLGLDQVRAEPQDGLDSYFHLLCGQLGLRRNDGYHRTSLHDRIEVRSDRTLGNRSTREVLRATRDGFDRFPVVYHLDEPGVAMAVVARSNCRIGRTVEHRHTSTVVAEVLLPRPLAAGESIIVELDLLTTGATEPDDGFWRSTDQRTRLFLTEVVFDPEDLPLAVDVVTDAGGRETRSPLAIGAPTVTLLLEDFGPGIYGLRWRWA